MIISIVSMVSDSFDGFNGFFNIVYRENYGNIYGHYDYDNHYVDEVHGDIHNRK